MKIQISYPNDYTSDARMAEAIEQLGLQDADEELIGERLIEVLADCAREASLAYIQATDFGAIWEGTPEQVAAARDALPAWAGIAEIEESE